MAYFKDPETGKVDSVEFYEEGIIGNTQFKVGASQLIFAPFNAPYVVDAGGGLNSYRRSAVETAKMIGLRQGFYIGSSATLIPYDPTHWPALWGVPSYVPKQAEQTHGGIFSPPATFGLCAHGDVYPEPDMVPDMVFPYKLVIPCELDPLFGRLSFGGFSFFKDIRFSSANPFQTINKVTGLAATFKGHWQGGPDPDLWEIIPTPGYSKTPWLLTLEQSYPGEFADPEMQTHEHKITKPGKIFTGWYSERFTVVGELFLVNAMLPTMDKNGKWSGTENLEALAALFTETITSNPRSYRDATFTINKPLTEIAYEGAMGDKTGFADPVRVTPHYNYYLQPYEKITRDLMINSSNSNTQIKLPEIMLPNIYGLLSDMTVEKAILTNTYKYADNWQWPTLTTAKMGGNNIPPIQTVQDAHDAISVFATPILYEGDASYKLYFNNYAQQLDAMAKNNDDPAHPPKYAAYHETSQKYQTTGVSATEIKDLTESADEFKGRFPMHVDIEIPAYNSGKVGKILQKADFFNEFMQAIMAAMQPRHNHTSDAMQGYWQETAIIKKDSFIKKETQSAAAMEDHLYSEPVITFWLNEILQQTFFPNLGGGAVASKLTYDPAIDNNMLLKLNNKITGPVVRPPVYGKESGNTLQFMNNIKWANARIKINNLVEEEVRGVVDIFSGKEAYSEVLFYEIVKFRLGPDAPPKSNMAFVQNIFLPNVTEMEMLKYVDTQIKLGEEYYYHIYAHTFVVGTQYEPDNFEADWWNHAGRNLSGIVGNYKWSPSVYLMRVPFYNTWVTMHDAMSFQSPGTGLTMNLMSAEEGDRTTTPMLLKPNNLEFTPIISRPPVFPDTTCLPLYGERDKVLINANFNVGEYEFDPVVIDEDETKHINKLRRNQRKLTGPITFKSDDFCGQIEVLRIDKKPFSYSDFAPVANSRIAILGGSAAFGHIDDTLKPNKDYYYTLREKDVHDNYSNPSPIYQVRIVAKEGEAPYTIINMFFIEEVEEKQPKTMKKLMKYIRIQPSFKQSYLDDSSILAEGEYPTTAADIITDPGWIVSHIGDPELAKPIWGREFKFRFTSKKTGKKFDLNLKVKNPYAAPEENQASQGEQNVLIPGKC